MSGAALCVELVLRIAVAVVMTARVLPTARHRIVVRLGLGRETAGRTRTERSVEGGVRAVVPVVTTLTSVATPSARLAKLQLVVIVPEVATRRATATMVLWCDGAVGRGHTARDIETKTSRQTVAVAGGRARAEEVARKWRGSGEEVVRK